MQFILIAVVFIALVYLIVGIVFASLISGAHRQPILKLPVKYDMEYEDIEFFSKDGVLLKGWFIPGTSKKTVIMTHPFPFNRHGFSPKRQGLITRFKTPVDLLKTAAALNKEGYSVLMFDFRNHGESGRGITAVGLNEYQDVVAAVNYINRRNGLEKTPICFVSFCMGANSTIVAMSKQPQAFDNVKCLVAVQPISAEVFLRNYTKDIYTTAGLSFLPLAEKFYKKKAGYSFSEMSPRQYCKDIKVPVLYIQGKKDKWTELGDIQSFYDLTNSEKELWLIEEPMKRFEVYNYVGENPARVLEFVNKYMQG